MVDEHIFETIYRLLLNKSFIISALIFGTLFISYFTIKYIVRVIIEDSNLKMIKINDKDSAFVDEYDSKLTHDNALEYIRENYGQEVLDNIENLVIKAKDFEARLLETLYSMRKILHIVELDFIEPKQIKDNINAAGKLMIHVDNEMRIFKNIFRLMSEQDATYKDEYKEIQEISARCKLMEKRINNICLALISESCLKGD